MTKSKPQQYKIIDALNDYVAILIQPLSEMIEVDPEIAAKCQNEGLVVGVGPEVNRNLEDSQRINPGDKVVVRGNKYQRIEIGTGCYAGKSIIMVHKVDMVFRHSHHDPALHVFTDTWTEQDTEQARANVGLAYSAGLVI